jgi:hypothetical protein
MLCEIPEETPTISNSASIYFTKPLSHFRKRGIWVLPETIDIRRM